MKKFISILFLLISFSVFSQTQRIGDILIIANDGNTFTKNASVNTVILDVGASKWYRLTAFTASGTTLLAASKVEVPTQAIPPLTDVLTAGNTTADGQTINSLNGDVQLNLRDGGDNIFDLTNDNGAFGKAWFYGDNTTAQYGFGASYFSLASNTSIEISSTLGASNYVSVSNSKLSVVGIAFIGIDLNALKIFDNTLLRTIGGGAFNAGISMNNTGAVTFNAGVKNSTSIGYSGTVKTDSTLYINQLAFSNGSGQTLLAHTPSASDFTATIQPASGILAYTTDTSNLGNSDLTLTGNRIVTMGANNLTFATTTTGKIGIGVAPTTAQLEISGIGTSLNTTVEISAKGAGSAQIPLLVKNSSGSQILRVLGDGQVIFNNSKLSTGDIVMRGDNESALFVLNAGTDNIGLGTGTPVVSALLQMSSTTQGFLTPSMTSVNRDAIVAPASGLSIYNNTTNTPHYYNGTVWVDQIIGIEGFFLDAKGSFGTGGGWSDEGFINDFPVQLFNQSASERAIYMFYGLSRAKFDVVDPQVGFAIYATSAPVITTGDSIVLQLEARYVAERESTGGAADETLQIVVALPSLVANDRQDNVFFTLDRTLISDQDVIHLKLTRLGGNSSDKYAADLGIGQAGIVLETFKHNP